MAAFIHNETWNRIKQLSVTSKHYTPRDKNELIAQEPTFVALDDIITIAAACIVTDQKTAVIKELVSNNIIVESSKCSFCSDFFLLGAKDKIRPIFN